LLLDTGKPRKNCVEVAGRSQYSDQTTESRHQGQYSVKANDLSVLQNVKTGSGASHSMGIGVLSGGLSGRGLKLAIHFHLVPELKMSGVIPPFLLYAFMVRTGTTFRSPSISPDKKNNQDRHSTYNVTMRRVRVITVAVEMQ